MRRTGRKIASLLLICQLVLLGQATCIAIVGGSAAVVHLAGDGLTLLGEDNGDWAGYFASPAGDVNGDGLGDLLVGAPMAGTKQCPYPLDDDGSCPGLLKGEGVAYLVLGRPREAWPSGPLNLADADASFVGCETASMTARQLYTAGDVNGDGYSDILISGWKCAKSYTGKAYLFLGRPDVESWGRYYPVEKADASFIGENAWDFLSYYTATAGDVNDDGYDDFLITSTHYDITGTQHITDAGKMYLVLGRAAADWGSDYPVALADASFVGEAESDRIGRAAVGVGDVNGDGYGDLMVGAISSDYTAVDAGQSYLFLGRATPGDPRYDAERPWWGRDYSVAGADASFVGEGEGDESGRRVAEAGDVNGDSYADFLIGSARNDQSFTDAGIGYLLLGRPEADWGLHYPLALADASFVGEARSDQAGRRLNGAGDPNGDGLGDLIVGAPHNARGGTLAGAAYLIYGRREADWGRYYPLEDADVMYVGKPDVGAAGYDMGWLGDFDGDGRDDYLIAAYGGRNNDNVPGEVYVVSGSVVPLTARYRPDSPQYYLGWRQLVAEFMDPEGGGDLATAQFMVGGDADGATHAHIRYAAAENALYLYDPGASGWLGPCTPGVEGLLSNGVIDFDCLNSAVSVDHYVLRVLARVRWSSTPGASALHGYLRAMDSSGVDTGLVEYPWSSDIAIDLRAAHRRLVQPGDQIIYRLMYGNAGGSVARGVVITAEVPIELEALQIDSTVPLATVSGGSPYVWSVGDLLPLQGGAITITGTVDPLLSGSRALIGSASISAVERDPRRNNRADVRVPVGPYRYLPLVGR